MEFDSASAGGIDAALAFARTLGLSTAGLAMLLAIATLLLRWRYVLRTKRQARIMSVWRPIIAASILGDFDAARATPLRGVEWMVFLQAWLHRHSALRGDATNNLNQLARIVGVDEYARNLLYARNSRDRLLGIITLGELGDVGSWEELVAFLSDPDPVASLACARALLKIDMVKAAPVVMAAVPVRMDWSLTRIASSMKDSDPTVMCAAARDAITLASTENLPRLLRLLSALECRNTLDVVMTALDKSDDTETVAACLRVLDDPRGLTMVRWYVNDERWPVRLQAVRALGRLGQARDTDVLMSALTDKIWWVRYRAAESLSMMPFLEDVDLARLQHDCEDSYGCDMLAQFRRLRELRGPMLPSHIVSPMPPRTR